MKKCLLSGYDSNVEKVPDYSIIIDNKKEYAQKYNWDLILKTDKDFDKKKPAAFSKVDFILEGLEKYDIVFWNDFDALFTNFLVDVSSYINEYDYIALLLESVIKRQFCFGNVIVKSNDYTKTFFRSLKTLSSWNNHSHPWEQRCFNEMAKLTKYEHIRCLNMDEFGAFSGYDWYTVRPWKIGDLLVHICPKQGDKWPIVIERFKSVFQPLIIR